MKTANSRFFSVLVLSSSGFIRYFRRFGIFFELVFHSDSRAAFDKKENAVPRQTGVTLCKRKILFIVVIYKH